MADKTQEVKSADPHLGVAVVDHEAAKDEGIKIPSDLSKVSDSKARELVAAGVVDDRDLPGKFYKRKQDGFTTRIPNYTFGAYSQELKNEWDEVKLVTDEPAAE